MPDPVPERPSNMKKRARMLLSKAAHLANASTIGVFERTEIERLHGKANRLLQEKRQKQEDLERAVSHPATHHTVTAWGALPGEPLTEFPRALRRTLLELGVSRYLANMLVDTGEGEGQKGEGKKGGRKGGGKKGKGKR